MKNLFVIMPFGIKKLDDREYNFDNVYESIIKPAGIIENWKVSRIDEHPNAGLITNQILKELLEADVVLAEITTPNPNVFYELGIRQTISRRGTILIAQQGTKLPFDISSQRVIFYDDSPEGILKARNNIIHILKSSIYDSPINSFFSNYRQGLLNDKNINDVELEFKHQLSMANSLGEYMLIWDWVKQTDNFPDSQLMILAKEFTNKQQWNLAQDVLEKAFKAKPKDVLVSKELGWVISKRGSEFNTKALNYLFNALELDPKSSDLLGIIGGIYKSENKLKEAIKYYSLGAKYSPNSNYMLITQAALEILANPNEPEKGISNYERLTEKILSTDNYETDVWSLVNLAEAYYVTGQIENSISIFNKIIRKFDDLKPIISSLKQISELGKVGYKKDDSERIINHLKLLISEHEKNIEELPDTEEVNSYQAISLPIIIHLSDLHFGSKFNGDSMHRFIPSEDDRRNLSTHIIDEIKQNYLDNLSNIILVVSGDMAYMGNESEFGEVLKCLNEICQELNIEKKQVVIVPGNHDINWIKDKGGPGKRFEDYLVFIYNFYGEELLNELFPFLSNDDYKITAPPVKPENIISIHNIHEKITVVGMNSCVYENNQHHYGYIGWQQFKNIKDCLNSPSINGKMKIAVLHHQIHPFPEPLNDVKQEEKWIDLSVVRDGGFVERKLQELNFDIVLHGHKHRPQLRETKVSVKHENFSQERPLLVFGAGSAGVNQIERGNIPNQFQTLEFVSFPRKSSIDFIKLTWHELEDEIGADWQTQKSWIISG